MYVLNMPNTKVPTAKVTNSNLQTFQIVDAIKCGPNNWGSVPRRGRQFDWWMFCNIDNLTGRHLDGVGTLTIFRNSAKKWSLLLKTKLDYAKFWPFWRKTPFFRWKLSKIAENFDHNIGPSTLTCCVHSNRPAQPRPYWSKWQTV
jgi:hypothetical protein